MAATSAVFMAPGIFYALTPSSRLPALCQDLPETMANHYRSFRNEFLRNMKDHTLSSYFLRDYLEPRKILKSAYGANQHILIFENNYSNTITLKRTGDQFTTLVT